MRPGRQPDPEALERMQLAMGHRGPDDHGVEIVGTVGLVHRRLAIVDPTPAGAQPMWGPASRWLTTYNGEIFNHEALRRTLPPVQYRSGTDTETLLHALESYGPAVLTRLNGLFAFVAANPVEGRVIFVRDRMGVKPLYWAETAEGVWFASEIAALLAAGIPRIVDRSILLHAVRHGWAAGRRTPIEGVNRLAPGSMMSIDLATMERAEERWYDAAGAVDPELAREVGALDREACTDRLEGALRASVHRRLMADVPVGTMCSGGLDSSLVTALVAERQPVLAFNASVRDQPGADESPWAELVASHLGVELLTVDMDAESWRSGLVDVVRHVEYPLNHESSVPMWMIAERARSRGVKVLLSGEGADELLGGYPWAGWDVRRAFIRRERPGARWREPLRARARHAAWVARMWRAPFHPGLNSPEVAAFEQAALRSGLQAYAHHETPARANLEGHLLSLLETYLPHLLNRQDKATMQASIETREPFLDPELIELALNLPLELRVLPEQKGILRDVGSRHLPKQVPQRPKVGFGWNHRDYLLPAARSEFLLDGCLRELHGCSRETWRRAIELPSLWLLPLWTAEIWCRAVLGGATTDSVEADLWR